MKKVVVKWLSKISATIVCGLFSLLTIFSANAQWMSQAAPGYRHVNAVFVQDSVRALIIGGNRTNDAIRLVGYTYEQGNGLWFVGVGELGPWLLSVAQLTRQQYIVTGESGGVLKSSDSGVHWDSIPMSADMHNRHFYSVYFADSTVGYIAGGRRTNDSIQTILKTIDGGETWSLQRDNLGYCLNNIFFTDVDTGFAVGDKGTILKTTNGGTSWSVVPITGNLLNRDFKQVLFVNSTTGFIVGGKKTQDSIQTILQTTDGGNNWSILKDDLGYMFNGIGFTSALHAYIAGDRGTVLESYDGGNSWTSLNLPFSLTEWEQLNAVSFWDDNFGYIVGTNGKLLRFLRHKPVAVTKDADNISTSSAQVHAKVVAHDIATHVVFEYGLTAAFGNEVALTDSVYGTDSTDVSANLTSLQTYSYYYYRVKATSSAGTSFGETKLFYANTGGAVIERPHVETGPYSNVAVSSVQFNGTVLANGAPTYAFFEYGLTTDFGSVIAVADSVYGIDSTEVSAQLASPLLLADHYYYYRLIAENFAGRDTGDIISFYSQSGDCVIPNCDFENWDTLHFDIPASWEQHGGITQAVTSYNGSTAIEISGIPGTQEGGVIIYGNAGEDEFAGGLGVNARPDSMVFWARYNVVPGDTVMGIAIFMKQGQIIDVHFSRITGSSGGGWQRISRPIVYSTQQIPDSILVGISSQRVTLEEGEDSLNIPGSVIAVDDVKFTGIPESIPNGDFEQIERRSSFNPLEWYADIDYHGGRYNAVEPTIQRVSGNSAIRLAVDSSWNGISTRIMLGYQSYNGTLPRFPVSGKHSKFYFYAKYLKDGNDTLQVNINMFKDGVSCGWGGKIIDTAITTYTLIEVPIGYMNPDIVPDSAMLEFSLGRHTYPLFGDPYPPTGNSVVFLDNVGFQIPRAVDSLALADSISGIRTPSGNPFMDLFCKVYPNPAQGIVNVEYFNKTAGETTVSLFDLQGRKMFAAVEAGPQGTVKKAIEVSGLPDGVYILKVHNNFVAVQRRIILKK